MHSPLLHAALLCLLTLQSAAALAKVEVEAGDDPRRGRLLVAKVSEDIAPGDYEALLKGLRANPGRYARKILLLDSIGGSAPEAMRMGRLLRETGFDVLVPSTGICQGSCIYLLAAGRKKTVRGHVGLHRPPFPAGDSALAHAAHHGQRHDPAAYLREMNVPTRLAEEMQRIAPHNMRVLDPKELARYRLN
ncbi:hypothetical protein [Pseudomonas benzenivorans]|uniref:Periplasmic protein-like protein n=1 Tax=Pseudomonas benzenivorans TaxID=556533 RepID=A0ABY5HCE6_9PSED|nr:hypothetical protein [Pseudomonas benzenivorans]UTW08676.1 hypothetical protein KDW96_05000 [Pseudomonas benzenivorans]